MPSSLALLSRTPVLARVAGRTFQVPFRPAGEWVTCLHQLSALAGLLADDDTREVLADYVWDHPQGLEELRRESLRIFADACDRPWWEASQLLAISVQPEVLGRLTLAGVDPWVRSVGEWCAATYALCVKGKDEKERLKFDFQLSIPPRGFEDEWDDGADPEAVMASIAHLTGG